MFKYLTTKCDQGDSFNVEYLTTKCSQVRSFNLIPQPGQALHFFGSPRDESIAQWSHRFGGNVGKFQQSSLVIGPKQVVFSKHCGSLVLNV